MPSLSTATWFARIAVRRPLLFWNLRGWPNLTLGVVLSTKLSNAALLTPAARTALSLFTPSHCPVPPYHPLIGVMQSAGHPPHCSQQRDALWSYPEASCRDFSSQAALQISGSYLIAEGPVIARRPCSGHALGSTRIKANMTAAERLIAFTNFTKNPKSCLLGGLMTRSEAYLG